MKLKHGYISDAHLLSSSKSGNKNCSASRHQFFLYETIIEQREKGKTFDQIAEWLNKKGYLSARGKKFKGNHVHSIVKKKRLKDEKLEKEYPEVWSDFYLDIFDKTLVNMFED